MGALVAWLVPLVAWLAAVLVLLLASRPRPIEPAEATFGPAARLPAAVINFLVCGCRVGPEALPATVFDLVASGHLVLSGSGLAATVTPHNRQAAADSDGRGAAQPVATFENLVLERITQQAWRSGSVPLRELSPGGSKQKLMANLHEELARFTRARGLSRRRLSGAARFALLASGLAVPIVSAIWLASIGAPLLAALLSLVVIISVSLAPIRFPLADRPTPEGREIAASWLAERERRRDTPTPPAGSGGYAEGIALGLIGPTEHRIAFEPPSDHSIWTNSGETWRLRPVRYRTAIRRSTVRVLLVAAAGASAVSASHLAMTRLDRLGAASGDAAPSLVGVAVLGAVAVALIGAAVGLGRRAHQAVITGPVVERRLQQRVVETGEESGSRYIRKYWLVVDDGARGGLSGFRIPRRVHDALSEGDVVTVAFEPVFGRIRWLQLVTSRSRPPGLLLQEPWSEDLDTPPEPRRPSSPNRPPHNGSPRPPVEPAEVSAAYWADRWEAEPDLAESAPLFDGVTAPPDRNPSEPLPSRALGSDALLRLWSSPHLDPSALLPAVEVEQALGRRCQLQRQPRSGLQAYRSVTYTTVDRPELAVRVAVTAGDYADIVRRSVGGLAGGPYQLAHDAQACIIGDDMALAVAVNGRLDRAERHRLAMSLAQRAAGRVLRDDTTPR